MILIITKVSCVHCSKNVKEFFEIKYKQTISGILNCGHTYTLKLISEFEIFIIIKDKSTDSNCIYAEMNPAEDTDESGKYFE